MTASRMQLARASLRLRSLYPFVLNALADIPQQQRASLTLVDLPCGDGMLAFPLRAAGFQVRALDLFPEYLNTAEPGARGQGAAGVFARMSGERLPMWLARNLFGVSGDAPIPGGLRAHAADMEGTLPLEDASVDVLVCAEGIEHVVDRHRVLAEFRRVLRPGGRLLLTTPNLLSARARLAFALTGQRAMRSFIDEYTSVWGVSPDGQRIYHGHAFLLSYYQLRYSLFHTGFTISRLLPSNWSLTSLALWPVFRPLVGLFTAKVQRRASRKFARMQVLAQAPYEQMYSHAVSSNLLLNATLMLEARAAPLLTGAERARVFQGAVFQGPPGTPGPGVT